MRLLIPFVLIVFVSSNVLADSWKHLNQGDQLAQQLLNQSKQKQQTAEDHPFYSGIPSESNLSDQELEGASQKIASKNAASQMVMESEQTRPQFKLDPAKDPLLLGSQKIQNNPLQDIGGPGTHAIEVVQSGKDETLDCEEPGEPSFETCTNTLRVKVRKIKMRKEWRGQIKVVQTWTEGPYGTPPKCPALKTPLSFAAQRLYFDPESIPLFHDITEPYKACAREGLTEGLAVTCHCGHCNDHVFRLPLQIQPEKIVSVVIETNLRNPGWVEESRYAPHLDLEEHRFWITYIYTPIIKITYEEDSYEILPDEWIEGCEQLETRADLGLCMYASKVCTQGGGTRTIEGIPITRECWQYTYTYACGYPSKDDCGPLRARGCVQTASACKEKVGNVCIVHTQTYQCKAKSQTTYSITGGNTPFCLDGNCRDQSWEANDEMMSSIAQLSILKEMQGKMNFIFKGTQHKCSKYILNFKDCCGSGKGWGKSVGLGGCSGNEKLLQKKRQARLCHYVGTYCAKKVLGKCVKKKSSFCCFGSKLLKAFQEQGRAQINLGWGSPEKPLCRGFTIEEIQRIDFSKLDLSEAFEDLMKNYSPSKLQGTGQKIGERMEDIQKGVAPPGEKQPKQRPEA